jgi:site-specific recombinase XerD
MRNTELPSGAEVSLAALMQYAHGWLLDSEIRQHSSRTLDNRRLVLNKLFWFLQQHEYAVCNTLVIRQFLAYLSNGHEQPGGCWGNPHLTKPIKPGTAATYDRHLRAYFSWLVKEEIIERSPMDKIAEPTDRPDQIDPFTDQEVENLIAAARKSNYPKRDEAVLWFLLDTGVRSSELCAIALNDVDLTARRCKIEEGKGGKSRSIWLGSTASKVLWNYLKVEPHEAHEPLFFSNRGEAFTRSGLLQLIERLRIAAGITQTRCSPHTFRHTFAISFLRAGGDVLTLQQLLGHTSLTMVNRYVKLAQTDLQEDHQRFSPADRLKARKRKGR